MAQTTVELGRLLTTDFKLFDFNYPFDDQAYKTQLEKDVIEFFYDYEIGQETPDMFKRKFIARWQRIIPYYNKLHNTTLLSYNPLTNYSMEEALSQLSKSNTNTTTNNDTQTSQTGSRSSHSETDGMTSDYPQQPIAGGNYASGAANSETTTTDTDNGSSTNKATGKATLEGSSNSEYSKTIEGLTGTTYPELIEKHRAALMRISDMVIQEMKTCFILVF